MVPKLCLIWSNTAPSIILFLPYWKGNNSIWRWKLSYYPFQFLQKWNKSLLHYNLKFLAWESKYKFFKTILDAQFFLQANKVRFINGLASRLKSGFLKSTSVSLQFFPRLMSEVTVTPSVLPVVTDKMENLKYFNIDEYWDNLTTAKLGNVVLYTDVVPSTMPLLDG